MRYRYPTRVLIKIFDPDNVKWGGLEFRADKGKCYLPAQVEQIKKKVWNDLETQFPMLEYKIVPVGNFQYNFVCVGMKEVKPEVPKITIEGIM